MWARVWRRAERETPQGDDSPHVQRASGQFNRAGAAAHRPRWILRFLLVAASLQCRPPPQWPERLGGALRGTSQAQAFPQGVVAFSPLALLHRNDRPPFAERLGGASAWSTFGVSRSDLGRWPGWRPRGRTSRARSVDTIGSLEFAHVGDNLRDVGFRDVWNGRHVAELPVVAYHTELHRAVERGVRVVPRLVDTVHERRPLSGARSVLAVAQRAVCFEQGGALTRFGARSRVVHPPCTRAEHGDSERRTDGDQRALSTSARGATTILFGLAQARAARTAQVTLCPASVQCPHVIPGMCQRATPTTIPPTGLEG